MTNKRLLTGALRAWILGILSIISTFGLLWALDQTSYSGTVIRIMIIAIFWSFGIGRHANNINKVAHFLLNLKKSLQTKSPPKPPNAMMFTSQFYEALTMVQSTLLHLQQQHQKQQQWVSAVLDGLPFPVLVVNRDMEIEQTNAAAQILFERQTIGLNIVQIMRSPNIFDALERTLSTGEAAWREFQEHAGIEAIYRVHMAPFSPAPESGGASAVLVMIEDITERRRSEQMRVDFIANASHEIRTPLTAVCAMIETIRGPAKNDTAAKEQFLSVIGEQVDRLHHVVEDLMSLSRIELHEHARPSNPVLVGDVIQSVCRSVKWELNNRKIVLRIEVPEQIPELMGEYDEVERLVGNLVTNAIKYGNPMSEVRVIAYAHSRPQQLPGWRGGDTAIAISVADRGPGIPKEHIPRLTERFYRMDTSRSRNMGGTGLGLAIVKHTIQHHRGAMTIISVPNQGSVFTAYFPIYTNNDHQKSQRLEQ